MAEPTICIRIRDLLYRTRGRDWDYSFILQPEPLLGEGWYAIHRRIFAGVEPNPVPLLLRGTLGLGLGQPFLATAFTDFTRRDSQGRPIAHYLVWFERSALAAPSLSFGPALVEGLGAPLNAIFELIPEQVMNGNSDALDSLLRRQFRSALRTPELIVAGACDASVRSLGSIAP